MTKTELSQLLEEAQRHVDTQEDYVALWLSPEVIELLTALLDG